MNRENNKTCFHNLLKTSLLGLGAVMTLSSIAPAAPHNDVKDARRDVREARKDVKREKKDVRDAKQDIRHEQHDLKQERREDRHDNGRPGYNTRPNTYRPGYNTRPNTYRPGYNTRPNTYRPGYNSAYRTVTGRVSGVKSDQRFNLVVGGRIYNVQSTTRLPRRLNNGDVVRVYGVLSGSNDFNNSNVVILSNR